MQQRLTDFQRALAAEHFDYAMRLANQYCKRRRLPDRDGVRSAASMGLMDAARLWNPLIGRPFQSYAWRKIVGRIIDDFRIESRWRLKGWKPTKTNIGSRGRSDTELPLDSVTPDTTADRITSKDTANHAMRKLPNVSKLLMRMVHGDGMTMKQAGRAIGYCESRVSQLLSTARKQLEATCGSKS